VDPPGETIRECERPCSVKSGTARADVDHMAVVATFLFLALMALGLTLVGVGYYYVRVLRPQLARVPAPPSEPTAAPATADATTTDSLATFVEQLQELARLRDQGLLTPREFTAKKTELLQRI
jgi:Short C-terminal domain